MGILTGRFSEAHEVAALALYLASDLVGNVTGADYGLDGGTAGVWLGYSAVPVPRHQRIQRSVNVLSTRGQHAYGSSRGRGHR